MRDDNHPIAVLAQYMDGNPSTQELAMASESNRFCLPVLVGEVKFLWQPTAKETAVFVAQVEEQLRHEEQPLESHRRSRLHHFSVLFQPSNGRDGKHSHWP
jgi:hypothetical protein